MVGEYDRSTAGSREVDGTMTGDEPTGEGEESLGITSEGRERVSSRFFLRLARRFVDDEGLLLESITAEDEGEVEEDRV